MTVYPNSMDSFRSLQHQTSKSQPREPIRWYLMTLEGPGELAARALCSPCSFLSHHPSGNQNTVICMWAGRCSDYIANTSLCFWELFNTTCRLCWGRPWTTWEKGEKKFTNCRVGLLNLCYHEDDFTCKLTYIIKAFEKHEQLGLFFNYKPDQRSHFHVLASV